MGFAAVMRRQGIFAVPVEGGKTGSGSDWARRDTRDWGKSFELELELRKRVELGWVQGERKPGIAWPWSSAEMSVAQND